MDLDARIERDIWRAYQLLATRPAHHIKLSRIADFTDIAPDSWDRVLTAMNHQKCVHLTPESNQQTLADYDRAAAVRIGGEDRHLISFDGDYQPPTSW